jgi:hypothetical protein
MRDHLLGAAPYMPQDGKRSNIIRLDRRFGLGVPRRVYRDAINEHREAHRVNRAIGAFEAVEHDPHIREEDCKQGAAAEAFVAQKAVQDELAQQVVDGSIASDKITAASIDSAKIVAASVITAPVFAGAVGNENRWYSAHALPRAVQCDRTDAPAENVVRELWGASILKKYLADVAALNIETDAAVPANQQEKI